MNGIWRDGRLECLLGLLHPPNEMNRVIVPTTREVGNDSSVGRVEVEMTPVDVSGTRRVQQNEDFASFENAETLESGERVIVMKSR